MKGTTINTVNGGPSNRFAKINEDKKRRKIAELNRFHGLTEEQAIVRAEEGNEFICKACRNWCPREDFEYVFDGETKLASRCEPCRAENRRLYRNKR